MVEPNTMSRFNYQVESLLTPPVELIAATTYFLAAIAIIFYPSVFMLSKPLAMTFIVLFVYLGYRRLSDAILVIQYQSNIKVLPRYSLSFKDLPVSKKYQFLGRGFAWGQCHLQRVDDLLSKPQYLQQKWFYRQARLFERKHEHTFLLKYLAIALNIDHSLNPVRPLPEVGGLPYLHGVGLFEEEDIYINLSERVAHTLVLGTTRQGKTRLAESLITQDIRRGEVVIVFDPKGDSDLMKRCYIEAKRAGRLDKLLIFHLGFPELSSGYSPISEYQRITEVATRIANAIPGEGAAASFKQFVWRYVNVLSRSADLIGKRIDYALLKRYAEDIEPLAKEVLAMYFDTVAPADWRDTVMAYEGFFNNPDNKKYNKKNEGLNDRRTDVVAMVYYLKNNIKQQDPFTEMEGTVNSIVKTLEYDQKYYDKLIASLLPLLEKLTTGPIAKIISPQKSSSRPPFTWQKIIREGGIVYCGFDALTDPEVASVVSESMFADLTSVAGEIYKNSSILGSSEASATKKISVHADEINELMGDRFIPMVNKGGGAGIQVTGYTQTQSDIVAKFNSKDKAGQALGNFNTLIMFRVQEIETAEILTKKVNEVVVHQITDVSRASDSSKPETEEQFTSTSEQRVTTERKPLIDASMLMNLPKGQAFALLNGSMPYKLRIPLSKKSDFNEIPNDIHEMAQSMEKIYAVSSINELHQFNQILRS